MQDQRPNGPSSSSTSTATIRGAVFYNDQRTHGLFADRQDMATRKGGLQCDPVVKRPDCSTISRRLAELRTAREGQAELIKDFKGGSVGHLQDQLELLDAQIAAQEKSLADCRTHNTAVDYSNSETYDDDNAEDTDQNLKGPLGEGAQWRDNIVKALCDWYDATDDDDRNLTGRGDHFAEDIYSMWSNLRNMYVDADKYGGKFKNPGLWFCDYVRYYLDVRKSASAVGQSSHADYENSIRDVIYNNNIGCFMAAPK